MEERIGGYLGLNQGFTPSGLVYLLSMSMFVVLSPNYTPSPCTTAAPYCDLSNHLSKSLPPLKPVHYSSIIEYVSVYEKFSLVHERNKQIRVKVTLIKKKSIFVFFFYGPFLQTSTFFFFLKFENN